MKAIFLIWILLEVSIANGAPKCVNNAGQYFHELWACELYKCDVRIDRTKFDPSGGNGGCVDPVGPNDTLKIQDWIAANPDSIIDNSSTPAAGPETHAFVEVMIAIKGIANSGPATGRPPFDWFEDAKISYEYKKDPKGSTCDYQNKTLKIRNSGLQNLVGLSKKRKSAGHGRNNPTHIAHELGHCLGHTPMSNKPFAEKLGLPENKKTTVYALYRKFLGEGNHCWPSWYSSCYRKKYPQNKGNEEFGEVLGLYVTNPDVLHQTPGCSKAVEFFAILFNENYPTKEITCANRRDRLRGAVQPLIPSAEEPAVK